MPSARHPPTEAAAITKAGANTSHSRLLTHPPCRFSAPQACHCPRSRPDADTPILRALAHDRHLADADDWSRRQLPLPGSNSAPLAEPGRSRLADCTWLTALQRRHDDPRLIENITVSKARTTRARVLPPVLDTFGLGAMERGEPQQRLADACAAVQVLGARCIQ